MKYEYGILFKSSTLGYEDIHRSGYTTLEEAEEWIKEWIEDGGRKDTFKIVRRLISDWEVFE